MERRKQSTTKSSPLPRDYLKMVNEVFAANFDAGLKAFSAAHGRAQFEASGGVFVDEVVLCISLMREGEIAATSVYASCDFDPKASSPTMQDLLSSCVDAIGSLYSQLLDLNDPEALGRLANQSLSALENVPFDWSPVEVDRRRLHLKIDKSNPRLDKMTDEWLQKNDPNYDQLKRQEQEEMEKLFVTGDKSKGKGKGPGTLH